MSDIRRNNNKSFSWGVIILMFILFFPVGIFMLVKKMTTEKFNYAKNGKSLQTLGWVLLIFGCIYILMGFSGEFETEDGGSIIGSFIIAMVLFIGCGMLCILKGKKYVKLANKFNRYVAIVNANNNHSIDNIAAVYPIDYDTASKDLQDMLDAGFFLNSYIDFGRRELVMPQNLQPTPVKMMVSETITKTVQPQVVKCPNCGATNTLNAGALSECEYCGTPL